MRGGRRNMKAESDSVIQAFRFFHQMYFLLKQVTINNFLFNRRASRPVLPHENVVIYGNVEYIPTNEYVSQHKGFFVLSQTVRS